MRRLTATGVLTAHLGCSFVLGIDEPVLAGADAGGSIDAIVDADIDARRDRPEVTSLSTPLLDVLAPDQTFSITCEAMHPTNQSLVFEITAVKGTIEGQGSSVTYRAPSHETLEEVTCRATDPLGEVGELTVSFTVIVEPALLAAGYLFEGDTQDATLSENHGLASGGVTFVEDRFGNPQSALSLDGTDGFVEIPGLSGFPGGPEERYTIAAVLRPEAGGTNRTIVAKASDISNQFTWQIRGNSVHFSQDGAPGLDCAVPAVELTDGVYVSIALVVDGEEIIGYLNGDRINDCAPPEGLTLNSEPIRIGKGPSGDFFRGSIDNLRIYHSALPEEDIVAIANNDSF